MKKMIILVGVPGSGKSTLCQEKFPHYKRISQDELGSREACLKECENSLSVGMDVIIDRTNINKKQRKYWIDLGLYYGYEINCIVLDINEEEAVARIHNRKHHPTISITMPLDKKKAIVYNFMREYEAPQLLEGFNNILFVRV